MYFLQCKIPFPDPAAGKSPPLLMETSAKFETNTGYNNYGVYHNIPVNKTGAANRCNDRGAERFVHCKDPMKTGGGGWDSPRNCARPLKNI